MISFIVTGLLGVYLLPLLILSAPVMILGLYLGGRAHIGVSNRQMLILIGSLLLLAAVHCYSKPGVEGSCQCRKQVRVAWT